MSLAIIIKSNSIQRCPMWDLAFICVTLFAFDVLVSHSMWIGNYSLIDPYFLKRCQPKSICSNPLQNWVIKLIHTEKFIKWHIHNGYGHFFNLQQGVSLLTETKPRGAGGAMAPQTFLQFLKNSIFFNFLMDFFIHFGPQKTLPYNIVNSWLHLAYWDTVTRCVPDFEFILNGCIVSLKTGTNSKQRRQIVLMIFGWFQNAYQHLVRQPNPQIFFIKACNTPAWSGWVAGFSFSLFP